MKNKWKNCWKLLPGSSNSASDSTIKYSLCVSLLHHFPLFLLTWISRDDVLYPVEPLLGLPARPRLEAEAAGEVAQENGVAVARLTEAGTHLKICIQEIKGPVSNFKA